MKKCVVLLAAAALLLGAQLAGCSGSDGDSRDEKSVTRKVADEAAREMRAPIEKARDVKRQAEKRLDEMQKTVKE